MRWFAYFIKYLAGTVLIFSGLVKLNDPVGTEIKLQEYFDVFAADFWQMFEIFAPAAMPIGMFLIILEIVIGVALLINYRFRWTLTIMTLLMVFFTFLTFYSAYFGKVHDCGCFGDAIPLSPWQSFTKDVIFLVFISIILWERKYFAKEISLVTGNIVLIGITLISIFIGNRAINHLPFMDFLPYAVGENIPANMQAPEDPVFSYVFEKDGKKIKSDKYLTEANGYTYVSHKIINEDKTIPKISDYNIWNDEVGDYTNQSFIGYKLFIIFYDNNIDDTSNLEKLAKLIADLGHEVEAIIITSTNGIELNTLLLDYNIRTPFYYGDATVLKTMIRSNPGIILLEDGTVRGKWHYNDIPDYNEVIGILP